MPRKNLGGFTITTCITFPPSRLSTFCDHDPHDQHQETADRNNQNIGQKDLDQDSQRHGTRKAGNDLKGIPSFFHA